MVISIIWSDEVLNPAWEKRKSGFAACSWWFFCWAAEVDNWYWRSCCRSKKRLWGGLWSTSESCYHPAAISSQAGIHFFHCTGKGNSLDLSVPWAGQGYRLLPEIILCACECRSHCDRRERYCCWAAVRLQAQPLPCNMDLFLYKIITLLNCLKWTKEFSERSAAVY